MEKQKVFLIFSFILLFSINFILAQPTTIINNFDEGYTIDATEERDLVLNQNYLFNFFLYNNSNGVLIGNSSVNCTIYLSNQTGDLTLNQKVDYNDYWHTNIDGSNFSSIGQYNYGISCQGESLGGAYVDYFEVTKIGKSFNSGQTLVAVGTIIASIAIMFLFMIFGFKLTETEKLYPIGFLFIIFSIFFSIYLLHQSFVFSNNILELSTFSRTTEVMYITVLWTLSGVAIISFALMLIAFIKELGNTIKKKKYGDDFNPITDVYE